MYTGKNIVKKRGRCLSYSDLDDIENVSVIVREGKIKAVLPTAKVGASLRKGLKKIDGQGAALMPGLIDSHTHLVFAGDRAGEFGQRCAGVTYAEIAQQGGGILTTVNATRLASQKMLLDLAVQRVKRAQSFGVTTLECKTGYGLDFETELKCLRVVDQVRKIFPEMTFVKTAMPHHAIPQGVSRETYFTESLQFLSRLHKESPFEAVDIFVDQCYFTHQDLKKLAAWAKRARVLLKVHADELVCTGSAGLGAKLGAVSVDHLLKISDPDIRQLAKSNTIATLLPGTALFLREPFAPARALLDAGARVALATDFNPGSCYSLNLPFMMHLGALHMRMNPAEVFAAVTINAAAALGQKNRGAILPGFIADFTALPVGDSGQASFEQVLYHMAW